MKVFAVVPALLVLVSLCGSPVPPPPASLSGTVYYDANHNGIHDSCDSPLGGVNVQATGSDGKNETATVDADGGFRIDRVPSGDVTVSLHAPTEESWLVTTPPSEVTVKGPKDTSGVVIGSATASPLPTTGDSVIGVIYNDANGNFKIDPNECGIQQAQASVSSYEKRGSPPETRSSADGTFVFSGLPSPGTVSVSFASNTPSWIPTSMTPGACAVGAAPQQVGSTNVYEADLGFRQGQFTGSISGVLFDDANGNGIRDDGEAGIGGQSIDLGTSATACGAGEPSPTTTDADGHYSIGTLAPGEYAPEVNFNSADINRFVRSNWPKGKTIAVNDSLVITDIPATMTPAGYVRAFAFYDLNGNGVQDPGEKADWDVDVCLHPAHAAMTITPAGACGVSVNEGFTPPVGPLDPGEYDLKLTGRYDDGPLQSTTPTDVTVLQGENNFDVGILPPPAVVGGS
jgi:hypothetical protein